MATVAQHGTSGTWTASGLTNGDSASHDFPCEIAAWMIDTDHILSRHAPGRLQNDPELLEVVSSTVRIRVVCGLHDAEHE